MFKVTMNTTSKRGAEEMLQAYGEQLVEFLANKYGFDAAEAKEALASVVVDKPKAANKTNKTKKPKADKPTVPLPFCGQVKHDWCQAIVSNNKLFSQCTSAKKEGCDYCSSCMTKATKNNGVPPYGVIQDRLNGDYKDKDGNAPVKYGNVLKAKKIDPEEAKAEAAKFGLTIPEEEFEVIVKKKGRKSKKAANVEASDTEEDMFAQAKKQAEEAEEVDDTESDMESSDDDEPLIKQCNKRKTKAKGPTKKLTLDDAETSGSSSDELKSAKKKQRTPEDETTPEDEKNINEELEEKGSELDLEEYDMSDGEKTVEYEGSDEDEGSDDDEITVSPVEYEGVNYNVDENFKVYHENGDKEIGVQNEDGSIEFYDEE